MYVFFMVEPDLNDVTHLTWSVKLSVTGQFPLGSYCGNRTSCVTDLEVHFFHDIMREIGRPWVKITGDFPFVGRTSAGRVWALTVT
jgi:hypothetical protein